MAGIIFSQKSIFHLNKLSNEVYRKSSRRFRLTDQHGVKNLIRFAEGLRDVVVNQSIAQFMGSLNMAERDALMAEHMMMPAGMPLGSDRVPGWFAHAV